MLPNLRSKPKALLCAATIALATAFVFAPAAIQLDGLDDAAFAQGKSGDKGNKGGNGNQGNKGGNKEKGNKGGNGNKSEGNGKSAKSSSNGVGKTLSNLLNFGQSKKQSKSSNGSSKANGSSKTASVATSTETETSTEMTLELVAMHPKEKGRWNASPAQAAFDAQIRNAVRKGEFNGSTVATLAGYDLILKYGEVVGESDEAVGETLSQTELDALDILRDRYGLDDGTPPEDVDSYLNDQYGSEDYDAVFSYTDEGGLACSGSDCPDPETDADVLSMIEEDAAAWEPPTEEEIAEGQEEAAGELLEAYETTIQMESNKTPSDWDQLYYNMADDLGYTHPDLIPEPEVEEDISES